MSDVLNNLLKEAAARKREALGRLLEQCTDSQKEKFKRIFPDGAGNRIDDAIRICERTVASNNAKQEADSEKE